MYPDQHFFIPFNELDVDKPEPGWAGKVAFNVEVVSVDKEGVHLMKHGSAEVIQPFKDIDLNELRKKIGTVEDEEEPFTKRKE